mgnify:CR=1 FL=1
MDLNNNIALVTGGASGLGRGTVEHFVSRGCKVAILDINDNKAKEVIDLLGSENVTYVNTDVMSEESVTNAIKEIKDTSINIAVESVKKIITTSVDKSKLDNLFNKNLEETKTELKKISS